MKKRKWIRGLQIVRLPIAVPILAAGAWLVWIKGSLLWFAIDSVTDHVTALVAGIFVASIVLPLSIVIPVCTYFGFRLQDGAYRKFVLWKGAYLLMERTSLPQLGSRFYDSPGDWSAVGQMKRLKILKIENLAICDWGFLENLGNLQDLNLCGTNFAREDIILRLKNLQQLNLTGTGFTDCSILLQIPKLKRVNLAHCNLKNESALEQLTASVLKS